MLPTAYSIRNLTRRRLRTMLTVAGVALVTLLIVVLSAFSRGITATLANAAKPANVMILSSGAENDMIRSAIDQGQAYEIAQNLPGVAEVAGVRAVSIETYQVVPIGRAEEHPDEAYGPVRGVNAGAYIVHDRVFVTHGRVPRGDGEMMVGALAGSRLGMSEADLAIGATLWFCDTTWTIVGRFLAPGSPLEAELWVDLEDLMVVSRRQDITLITATLASPDMIPEAELYCLERPHLEALLQRETDFYAQLLAFMTPVATLTQVLALLVFVGGVVGCANTLYANTLARTQEFGALQTIGYQRRELVGALLLEALVLVALAGLLGVAASVIVGGVPIKVPMGAFLFRANASDALVGVFAALVIGVVGALFPAFRIVRMSVVDALRSTGG